MDKKYPDTLGQIADFIFTSKYARYIPDLKRRETWEETVSRVEDMHLKKYDFLSDEDQANIVWAFDYTRRKEVVPSMRSMQFGGQAIEAHNAKIYNCAVRHIDSIRSFAEVFYLLLCGCGVGVGLTDKYLGRLPDLVGPQDKTGAVLTYVVEDTIEGWSDSIEALMMCYFKNTPFSGRKFVPDFSKIREEGTPIKTGGGKAPGYKGLKAALLKIKQLLDRVIESEHQTRLKTINAYDIMMHCSDAVLSGGVRRSAMSVMFAITDLDMMNAKRGNWFEENPQRARSNNSVVLIRNEVTLEQFIEIVKITREWGEPGFVFADTMDVLYNPCFEIAFVPVTDDGVCGVQFCNLTSTNGSKVETPEDFYRFCQVSAILGTLQAGYTDFPYLSNAAKQLTEEEALLGCSITAMMDNIAVNFDPEVQRNGASIVVETNKIWANKLGINQAARTTDVKPEGTSTLALGSMASGVHAAHAHKMFRRIQVNKLENPYRFLKQFNPHLAEESVWSANKTDDILTFPVKLDSKVTVKASLNALAHLDLIRSTQQNWVMPGTTEVNKKPVHHNVSCTVLVDKHEWEPVTEYLYLNRNDFSAVSLLAVTGDKDYAQAPMEAVVTAEDNERFEYMMDNFIPVDFRYMEETEDGTTLMQEISCAGGACIVQ